MMGYRLASIIPLLLLGLAEARTSNQSSSIFENVYLGGHLPFTGPAAAIVAHAYDGMVAAILVHGSTLLPGYNVSLNISDDQFDARLGIFGSLYHIDAGTPVLMAAANRYGSLQPCDCAIQIQLYYWHKACIR